MAASWSIWSGFSPAAVSRSVATAVASSAVNPRTDIEPLSAITLWKSPFASGNASIVETFAAPPEHFGGGPNNVTIFGESDIVANPLQELDHVQTADVAGVGVPWVFRQTGEVKITQSIQSMIDGDHD